MTDYVYFRKVGFAEVLKGKTIAKVTHSSCEGEVLLIFTFTDGTWLEISHEPNDIDSGKGAFCLWFAAKPYKERGYATDRYTKLDGPWIREDAWSGDI